MPRRRTKDLDLQPGFRRINGRVYFQPTTRPARDVPAIERTIPVDGSIVYFVRARRVHAVKIGFTSSRLALRARMRTLLTGSPHGRAVARRGRGEP